MNEKYMSEYLAFYLTDVEPKIQEIFFAETKRREGESKEKLSLLLKMLVRPLKLHK